MAVTLTQSPVPDLIRCIDECAREKAVDLGQAWIRSARLKAPVATGRYITSFTSPDVSGGNGNYVVTLRNTANHASYIETGWVSRPGKKYANSGYPGFSSGTFAATGDGVWGHGRFRSGGPVELGLCDAIAAIS